MKNLANIFAVIKNQDANPGAHLDNADNTFESDFKYIINWIVGVVGLVAVVVIIIGGVTYMTSNGDPGKVKKAKDTILYGIIGLLVCALAFAIVNFVIGGLFD